MLLTKGSRQGKSARCRSKTLSAAPLPDDKVRLLQESDTADTEKERKMEKLAGKTAFITGGAGGLGLAIAKRCAAEQMNVVIADIERAELEKAQSLLGKSGCGLLSLVCDIGDEGSIREAAEKAIGTFGEVDLVFNNAGVAAGTFLWETTPKDWEWMLRVNVYGLINSIRVFVPMLLRQKTECHIVNTASVAGFITSPGNGAYSMTKSAIISLSETLDNELRMLKANIGVTVACPDFVRTRLFEAERNRPPELRNGELSDAYRKQQAALQAFLTQGVLNGLEPEAVVDEIFQAIRQRRLYAAISPASGRIMRAKTERLLEGWGLQLPAQGSSAGTGK
jgi:NAD(P)-dependent dehydrogenase (short-subunit alcohol dehydrogenase family)